MMVLVRIVVDVNACSDWFVMPVQWYSSIGPLLENPLDVSSD